MSWDEIKDVEDSENLFFKFAEGDSRIRPLGDPRKYDIHWIGGERYVCSGEDCSHCANGDKPQTRYVIWIIDRKTDSIKILESGITIFAGMKAVGEEFGVNPGGSKEGYDFKVTRKGTGLDTKYTVMHIKNTPLTEKEKEKYVEKTDKTKIENLYSVEEYEEDEIDKLMENITNE